MSAVGDVHRDFKTKTKIGEARGGPLHGVSPKVMIESGGLCAAAGYAARGMPSVAFVPKQRLFVTEEEQNPVIYTKSSQGKVPQRAGGLFA